MTDILSRYERFAFAILSCSMAKAQEAIIAQSAVWERPLSIEVTAPRDVRCILDSPDGPLYPPAIKKAILLSEVDGVEGQKTLFVSSVADGYISMIHMVSKSVPKVHLAVQVSRLSCEYPRNSITAVSSDQVVRAVYAMRDTNGWDFFEKGEPLPFEEPDFYLARRKKDRLNPRIVSRCLIQEGYGSLDEDFWISSEAALLLCEPGFRLSCNI
jgi:hypothetical protein